MDKFDTIQLKVVKFLNDFLLFWPFESVFLGLHFFGDTR